MKKLIFFVLLAFISFKSFAIDYNWKGTGLITNVNNWSTQQNSKS